MTPVALQYAESLARIAAHSGAPFSEYALTLNVSEGFELLEWFRAQHEYPCTQFDEDVAQAIRQKDPWVVLQYFTLQGFEIVRCDRSIQ